MRKPAGQGGEQVWAMRRASGGGGGGGGGGGVQLGMSIGVLEVAPRTSMSKSCSAAGSSSMAASAIVPPSSRTL